MIKEPRRATIRLALATVAGLTSTALARTYCYVPTWYQTTTTCLGQSCAGIYINCPGQILCTLSPTGGGPDPIVTGSALCHMYIGGTGSCANGCTGGTQMLGSAGTVTIPTQTCATACIVIQPVPE